MPYKSDAQRKYFNANKALQAKGVDVDEWNDSSRGKKLPHKVQEPMSEIRALAKKAAQLKQASVLGGVLRQGTQAVKTVLPKLKPAVALPGRGAHRSGQVEAYNAMKGNSSIEDQRGYMRDGLNTAITAGSVVPGFPAGFLALLQGYGQNAKTQLAAGRLKEQEEEERSNPIQQVAKAAALKVVYGT